MPFDFQMDWNCNQTPSVSSLCNLNKENNIWYENNACRLDELTYDQVYYILCRNPNAKRDLLRITDDASLVALATQSGLIIDDKEDDARTAQVINNPKHTIPFYTLFKGNSGGGF